jgi:hypothetical protein
VTFLYQIAVEMARMCSKYHECVSPVFHTGCGGYEFAAPFFPHAEPLSPPGLSDLRTVTTETLQENDHSMHFHRFFNLDFATGHCNLLADTITTKCTRSKRVLS